MANNNGTYVSIFDQAAAAVEADVEAAEPVKTGDDVSLAPSTDAPTLGKAEWDAYMAERATKREELLERMEEQNRPDFNFGRLLGASVEGTKDVARNTAIGVGALEIGVARQAERRRGTRAEEIKRLREATEKGFDPDSFKGDVTGFGGEEFGRRILNTKELTVLQKNPDYYKSSGFWEDVFRAAPQLGAQLIVSIPTGGTGGAAFMGLQILGAEYESMIENGVTHDRALTAAAASAIAQAPLEAIGISKASNLFGVKKVAIKKLKEIATSMGTEGFTEMMQSLPSHLANLWAEKPDESVMKELLYLINPDNIGDKKFNKFWKDAGYEGMIGAVLGGVAGGAATVGKTSARYDAEEEAAKTKTPNQLLEAFGEEIDSAPEDVDVLDETRALAESQRRSAPEVDEETGRIKPKIVTKKPTKKQKGLLDRIGALADEQTKKRPEKTAEQEQIEASQDSFGFAREVDKETYELMRDRGSDMSNVVIKGQTDKVLVTKEAFNAIKETGGSTEGLEVATPEEIALKTQQKTEKVLQKQAENEEAAQQQPTQAEERQQQIDAAFAQDEVDALETEARAEAAAQNVEQTAQTEQIINQAGTVGEESNQVDAAISTIRDMFQRPEQVAPAPGPVAPQQVAPEAAPVVEEAPEEAKPDVIAGTNNKGYKSEKIAIAALRRMAKNKKNDIVDGTIEQNPETSMYFIKPIRADAPTASVPSAKPTPSKPLPNTAPTKQDADQLAAPTALEVEAAVKAERDTPAAIPVRERRTPDGKKTSAEIAEEAGIDEEIYEDEMEKLTKLRERVQLAEDTPEGAEKLRKTKQTGLTQPAVMGMDGSVYLGPEHEGTHFSKPTDKQRIDRAKSYAAAEAQAAASGADEMVRGYMVDGEFYTLDYINLKKGLYSKAADKRYKRFNPKSEDTQKSITQKQKDIIKNKDAKTALDTKVNITFKRMVTKGWVKRIVGLVRSKDGRAKAFMHGEKGKPMTDELAGPLMEMAYNHMQKEIGAGHEIDPNKFKNTMVRKLQSYMRDALLAQSREAYGDQAIEAAETGSSSYDPDIMVGEEHMRSVETFRNALTNMRRRTRRRLEVAKNADLGEALQMLFSEDEIANLVGPNRQLVSEAALESAAKHRIQDTESMLDELKGKLGDQASPAQILELTQKYMSGDQILEMFDAIDEQLMPGEVRRIDATSVETQQITARLNAQHLATLPKPISGPGNYHDTVNGALDDALEIWEDADEQGEPITWKDAVTKAIGRLSRKKFAGIEPRSQAGLAGIEPNTITATSVGGDGFFETQEDAQAVADMFDRIHKELGVNASYTVAPVQDMGFVIQQRRDDLPVTPTKKAAIQKQKKKGGNTKRKIKQGDRLTAEEKAAIQAERKKLQTVTRAIDSEGRFYAINRNVPLQWNIDRMKQLLLQGGTATATKNVFKKTVRKGDVYIDSIGKKTKGEDVEIDDTSFDIEMTPELEPSRRMAKANLITWLESQISEDAKAAYEAELHYDPWTDEMSEMYQDFVNGKATFTSKEDMKAIRLKFDKTLKAEADAAKVKPSIAPYVSPTYLRKAGKVPQITRKQRKALHTARVKSALSRLDQLQQGMEKERSLAEIRRKEFLVDDAKLKDGDVVIKLGGRGFKGKEYSGKTVEDIYVTLPPGHKKAVDGGFFRQYTMRGGNRVLVPKGRQTKEAAPGFQFTDKEKVEAAAEKATKQKAPRKPFTFEDAPTKVDKIDKIVAEVAARFGKKVKVISSAEIPQNAIDKMKKRGSDPKNIGGFYNRNTGEIVLVRDNLARKDLKKTFESVIHEITHPEVQKRKDQFPAIYENNKEQIDKKAVKLGIKTGKQAVDEWTTQVITQLAMEKKKFNYDQLVQDTINSLAAPKPKGVVGTGEVKQSDILGGQSVADEIAAEFPEPAPVVAVEDMPKEIAQVVGEAKKGEVTDPMQKVKDNMKESMEKTLGGVPVIVHKVGRGRSNNGLDRGMVQVSIHKDSDSPARKQTMVVKAGDPVDLQEKYHEAVQMRLESDMTRVVIDRVSREMTPGLPSILYDRVINAHEKGEMKLSPKEVDVLQDYMNDAEELEDGLPTNVTEDQMNKFYSKTKYDKFVPDMFSMALGETGDPLSKAAFDFDQEQQGGFSFMKMLTDETGSVSTDLIAPGSKNAAKAARGLVGFLKKALGRSAQKTSRLGELLDVEHNFRNTSSDVGHAVKVFHSKNEALQDEFVHKTMKPFQSLVNKHMPGAETKHLSQLVFAAEDTNYEQTLRNAVGNDKYNKDLKPLVSFLRDFFEDAKARYADRGRHVDYVQDKINELEGKWHNTEVWEDMKKITRDLAKMQGLRFIHIPSTFWTLEKFANIKDPVLRKKKMANLRESIQKRHAFRIADMVKRGIMDINDVDPAEILAHYGFKMSQDFSMYDIRDAMKKSKLIRYRKGKPNKTQDGIGWVKIPDTLTALGIIKKNFKDPKKGALTPYIREDALTALRAATESTIARGRMAKTMSMYKMLRFYNPLFLPMYDVVQSIGLAGAFGKHTPKALKSAMRSAIHHDEDYWEAARQGAFSKPYGTRMQDFIQKSRLQGDKRFAWQIAASRQLEAIANDFKEGSAIKLAKDTLGLVTLPWMEQSWAIAWNLDEAVRMYTYKYLMARGFNSKDAAQRAALAHGDYAGVPAATRQQLNKIFFTPTFKIAMAKAHGSIALDIAKGAASLGQGKKPSQRSAIAFRAVMAGFVFQQGINLMMNAGGYEDEEWGRKWKKVVDTPEGPREHVITFSHPLNLITKYLRRAWGVAHPDPHNMRPFVNAIRSSAHEFHPLFMDTWNLLKNKDRSGKQIVPTVGTSRAEQAWRIGSYVVSSTVPLLQFVAKKTGVQYQDPRLQMANEEFHKEFGIAMDSLFEVMMFSYTRQIPSERYKTTMKNMKKQFKQEMREEFKRTGRIREDWMRRAQERAREIAEAAERNKRRQ